MDNSYLAEVFPLEIPSQTIMVAERGNFYPDPQGQVFIDTKLNVFQFQNVLQAMGVLVPSDVVISLFAKAAKKGEDSSVLSIPQLSVFLNKSLCMDEDSKRGVALLKNLEALKNLGIDGFYWDTMLWVIAGTLLVLSSFTNGIIADSIRRNMNLVASTCYIITGGKFVSRFPIKEWNARVNSEQLTMKFKDAMMKNAEEYTKAKEEASTSATVLTFVQLLTYIEQQIYGGKLKSYLTKRDFEMLLLKELRDSYDSRALNDIMAIVDTDNGGSISPAELHHFLAPKKLRRKASLTSIGASSKANHLSRLRSVLFITLTKPLWIFSLSFFLRSSVNALNNIMTRFGKNLTPILGGTSPGFFVAWFSLVGAVGVTQIAYDAVRESFDLNEQAKVVLASSVRYASHYHRDEEIWIKFNANNGLDKKSFSRIFEEASIIMSEGALDGLFQAIDKNGDGFLHKDEIEVYLEYDDGKSRHMAIFHMCLKSIAFWSNFGWFFGGVAYVVPVYTTDSLVARWGYRFGALGYLVGAMACVVMVYQSVDSKHSVMAKINEVVNLLIKKDKTGLRSNSEAYSISVHSLCETKTVGSDEESQDHSQPSFERGFLYSDPLETFLSLPDGNSQELSHSCPPGMYCDNKGVGILYLCPSGFSEKVTGEETTASLSSTV